MPNRLIFVNRSATTAVFYDFDGNRQSSDDIALGTGDWRGIVATNDRIHFINRTTNSTNAYDFDGSRQSGDDIALGTGSWNGAIATDNRLHFINYNASSTTAYDFSGTRQSGDDIALGATSYLGGAASDNRLHFLRDGQSSTTAYDFSGTRQSGDDITLSGTANWRGGASSDDRLYFINLSTRIAVAYDFSGTAQSSDDISLGTGNWEGGVGIIEPTATYTLSTTDTDIRAGETGVEIDVVSDVDVSGLAQSDFSVAGGSITGFAVTDARNAVLTVTAGSAGTMTVTIAENAGTPGNAATSQNFTVNAYPRLEVVSGDNQSANIGEALSNNLVIRALDANENTVSGVTVAFSTTGGTLSVASAVTDSNGRTSTALTLPDTAGVYVVTATASGYSSAMFMAIAVKPLTLSMLANSSYDLFLIVENADSITFESGQTQPTGSSISNGIFTIVETAGTAYFTATNANGSTNFQIKINVVQTEILASEITRYRVEIAGIDVSNDLEGIPSVSESLDPVQLNAFKVNDAVVTLASDAGKYNSGVSGNFWETNSLNANGYQEQVQIFQDFFIDGAWVEDLQVSGLILRATENIEDITVSFVCVDFSSVLQNRVVSDFGTLEKYMILDTESTHTPYEYTPEASLGTIQTDAAQAWTDQTELTLQLPALATEGPEITTDLARITENGIETAIFSSDNPILKAKVYPQHRSIEYLANQLALQAGLYQVIFDVDTIELENPYILNRGSVSYATEKTRITRLPVDWVYDETDDRLLILLSHPDDHIADWLVQHDRAQDRNRVIYEFDNDIRVHRIARLDSTTYYILTTAYSDSDNESIYEYETDTLTLTERVTPSNSYPPLLSEFKVVGDHLYYGYFVSDTVGVARLATDGTTSMMVEETDNPQGAPAFDVTDSGEIYFASITGASRGSVTLASYTGAYQSDRTFTVSDGEHAQNASVRFRASSNSGSYSLEIYINGTLEQTLTGQDGGTINQSLGDFDNITSVRYVYDGDISIVQFFFTATLNPPNDLKVQHRATDGTITTLSDDVIDTSGTEASISGDFTFQAIYHDDHLYLLYTSRPVNTLHQDALNFVRFDVSGSTIPLPGDVIIDSNTNILSEPLHLFIHDGNVHFMRETALGTLNRVETDASFTSLGNLWYDSGTAWNQSVVRPLSIGDEVHTIMGYGDIEEDILTEDADVSQRDNMQHLVYTQELQYVLSDGAFQGSIYDGLAELALLVDATLSIEKGIIHIRQRRVLRAELDGASGTGLADIAFQNETHDFPSSGYLRINDEVIAYTGISGGAFTGITRGILGTTIIDHADESECVFVNNVVSRDDLTGGITIEDDTARLYNVIRNSSGSVDVRDATSIQRYGERVLTLDLGRLTDHNLIWQERIFQRYLENLKDLQSIITLPLLPTTVLRLTDVVAFRQGPLLYTLQIVSVSQDAERREVRGRTV